METQLSCAVEMIVCSNRIQEYFDSLTTETTKLYDVAKIARAKNLDPEPRVDIPLASTVAQRSEALVASLAPQLFQSGTAERIVELEKQYQAGDWRIALTISLEVAQQKFCQFADLREAIEVGSRVGLAYITSGVVAAPLEGLVEIKFKKRKDNKDYVAVYFSGPIRAAGGTAAAVSVLIVDYVRKQMGIADYDITPEEIKRYQVEIDDYLTKIAHRQYAPTAEEIALVVKNIGIEITGDPTETYEVSQQKYLPRVETNNIRGGMALVLTEGPTLKAEKLWKTLQKWAKDFDLENWNWLKDFIVLKNSIHQGAKTETDTDSDLTVKPVDSYLKDIVAGRPVFSYPMRRGGFRLRYGRSRFTGFASTAIHPATMLILNDYVATGTQIKMERPGKATVFSACDSIEGPIVKTKEGNVVKLNTEAKANEVKNQIQEILFLGDLLVNYGDFSENGQRLVPCGYNEEWWRLEVENALGNFSEEQNKELLIRFKNLISLPNIEAAYKFAEETNTPLHPKFTYHWKDISGVEYLALREWFLKFENNSRPLSEEKRILEIIGCEHRVENNNITFDSEVNFILNKIFTLQETSGATGLAHINSKSPVKQRDKSGTFIGTRMGRPEKAKLRKMKGTPVVLFPVGKEGGRLRSFQDAISKNTITSDFPTYNCDECNINTIYSSCELCGKKTTWKKVCVKCKRTTLEDNCCGAYTRGFRKQKIDINHYFDSAVKALNMPAPQLVKGVRGTTNKDKIVEHISKGILRATHKLAVNKDGTIRYDMTEMGVTHFKPKEIGTPIGKLKELGYEKDIFGEPLENDEQLLEILPQDVILPSCPETPDETADDIMMRACNFIDDLLEKYYHLPKYYNVKTKDDLIGHLIIGLAPHTSAGIIGRILGFSKTLGCFAHPYWHAAQRRNFDGDETCALLALDAFLNFSRKYLPDRRGSRSMDAPLVLTTVLVPSEVDTEVHGMDITDKYPLEFYRAAEQCKFPWDVKVLQVKDVLGKKEQYEGFKYTHETNDLNAGVRLSAYKFIPTMIEKLDGQLDLASRIRASDLDGVAALVIDKHFIRDIKGNLRKYTMQQVRCVKCNAKYRRPPLSGVCTICKGKLLFTIAEGSVKKYLEATMKLTRINGISPYMQQSMKLLKEGIESVFGKDTTKQIALNDWLK
ncbi:MAG: DNA polymerase II large subunit [DPANN group archaeon]|nr:DNA polymerase II large subunit [DPANN group archaeon]